jgi:hypothetical protein
LRVIFSCLHTQLYNPKRRPFSRLKKSLILDRSDVARDRGHVLTSNILALTLALLMAKAVTDGATD